MDYDTMMYLIAMLLVCPVGWLLKKTIRQNLPF